MRSPNLQNISVISSKLYNLIGFSVHSSLPAKRPNTSHSAWQNQLTDQSSSSSASRPSQSVQWCRFIFRHLFASTNQGNESKRKQYEGKYRSAMYAAVKAANPNWQPGQPFDSSILDSVTRELVESNLVQSGNQFVRKSIDYSV